MKAVILAGGYGTRLWPLTLTRPKPMLLLGDRPALHHIIKYLSSYGFDEIIITTNYLRDQIMDYFKSCSELDARLIYSDEYSPLGTAGSVKNVANYLDDTFAVIQGDNITDIDLRKMLEFHKRKGGVATIALKEVENPHLFGIVKLNSEEQILLFKEKPKISECFSNMINTGIYMLEPKILDHVPSNTECDFAKDLFPQLLSYNKKLYGFKAEGFWVDIGTPEGYLEASNWLLSRLEGKSIFAEVKDAIIRGPVLIGKDARIDDGVMIYGPAIIGDRCHIKNDAIIDSYSIIESDVEVSTNTSINKSIIYKDTSIDSFSWLSGCIIAEGCNIGSNVRIGDRSIIGARCEIGYLTNIWNGSRIWPDIKVKPNSVVRGFVRHLEQSYVTENNFKKLISEPKIKGDR
ncbi:MAG: NDP-sugar synthase [archaeon]|nr:NDP-sugar synthase [archaeon]